MIRCDNWTAAENIMFVLAIQFLECVFSVANWSDKKNEKQNETYHDVINIVSNESIELAHFHV